MPNLRMQTPGQSRYQSGLIVWTVAFSFVVILELYFTQFLSMTAYNANKLREYSGQSVLQLLRALFGTDTALLACMTYLAFSGKWRDSRREWIWILSLTLITMIVFSISGSRGASLRVLQFVFAVLLVRSSFVKISVGRVVVFVAIFLIFSAISFSVGDYYRITVSNGLRPSANAAIHQVQSDVVTEKQQYRVINRLGAGLDYAIFVTTHTPTIGSECTEKFLNYQYALKNTANYLVPGNIFSDAIINTSRIFSICYREMSLEHVINVSGYNSEPWTMWGLALLLHGWWGGFIFMFVCGVALHTLYFLICRTMPCLIAPYFAVLYVFLAPGLLLINFGLDHLVNTLIAVGLQLTIFLLHFFWGQFFRNWIQVPNFFSTFRSKKLGDRYDKIRD